MDYAVFLVSKGHKWSVGNDDGDESTTQKLERDNTDGARSRSPSADTATQGQNIDFAQTDGDDLKHDAASSDADGAPSTLAQYFEMAEINICVTDSKLWFVDNSNSPNSDDSSEATKAVSAATTSQGGSKTASRLSQPTALAPATANDASLPAVSTTVLLSFDSLRVGLEGYDVHPQSKHVAHAQLDVNVHSMALEVCCQQCTSRRTALFY